MVNIKIKSGLAYWLSGLILIFILFYIWRPFLLGFYHDDWANIVDALNWGAPFSQQRFAGYMKLYTNRPLVGMTDFVYSSIFGSSEKLWQIGASFNMLLSAVGLFLYLDLLFKLVNRKYSRQTAFVGASLYLVFPWTLGLSAWPISSTALYSFFFFCLFARESVNFLKTKKNSVFIPVLYLVASYLFHESFYFQFVPVLFLVFLLIRSDTYLNIVQKFKKLFFYSFFVQILFIFFNRLIIIFPQTAVKKASPDFLRIFISSLKHHIPSGLWEFSGNGIIILLTLGVFIFLVRNYFHDRDRIKKTAVIFLFSGFGIIISAFVYALAGYSVNLSGFFSRTAIAFNFWLVVILSASSALFLAGGRFQRLVFYIWTVMAFSFFSGKLILYTFDWADVWKMQNDIVSRFPKEKLDLIQKDSLILYKGYSSYKNLIVFGAPWDISNALKYTHSEVSNKMAETNLQFAVENGWKVSWKKGSLVLFDSDSGKPVYTFKTVNLWVWDSYQNTIYQIERDI